MKNINQYVKSIFFCFFTLKYFEIFTLNYLLKIESNELLFYTFIIIYTNH